MFLSRQKNPRSTFVTHGKIFSSSAAREGHSCCRLAKSLQSLLYGLQCNGHAYHQSCNGQWAGLPGCLSYSPFRHRRDKGRLQGLTRVLTIPNHMIPPHTVQCCIASYKRGTNRTCGQKRENLTAPSTPANCSFPTTIKKIQNLIRINVQTPFKGTFSSEDALSTLMLVTKCGSAEGGDDFSEMATLFSHCTTL